VPDPVERNASDVVVGYSSSAHSMGHFFRWEKVKYRGLACFSTLTSIHLIEIIYARNRG